jgi:hypothetical protein
MAIYLRSERGNGSWNRRCGFHLRGRNFLWRNFGEREINVSGLPRSYFAGGSLSAQAHVFEERGGIDRLWVTLLDQDREHKSSENQGTQDSRCKPNCIAIEYSNYGTCLG